MTTINRSWSQWIIETALIIVACYFIYQGGVFAIVAASAWAIYEYVDGWRKAVIVSEKDREQIQI